MFTKGCCMTREILEHEPKPWHLICKHILKDLLPPINQMECNLPPKNVYHSILD